VQKDELFKLQNGTINAVLLLHILRRPILCAVVVYFKRIAKKLLLKKILKSAQKKCFKDPGDNF